MSQGDQEAVVAGFNPSPSHPLSEMCLHNLFEHQADAQPHAPCIRTPHEELSYADVERQANKLARMLQGKGVGSGSAVGIMLDRDPILYIAILAVLKAGGAYLPMDSAYPAGSLHQATPTGHVRRFPLYTPSFSSFSLFCAVAACGCFSLYIFRVIT